MDESLVITSIIAAIVGAIVGFLASSSAKSRRAASKTAFGIIFFYGNGNARVAKVFPEVIQVRKNGDIDWVVVDFVPAPGNGDITFTWVEHPENPSLPNKNPLDTFNHDKRGKKVKGKLRAEARSGEKYRYQVKEDGVVLADPDVEIMQA